MRGEYLYRNYTSVQIQLIHFDCERYATFEDAKGNPGAIVACSGFIQVNPGGNIAGLKLEQKFTQQND